MAFCIGSNRATCKVFLIDKALLMKKSLYFLITIFVLFLNCKTTTDPIIYDNKLKSLDNSIKIMTQLLLEGKYESLETEISNYLTLYKDNEDLLLLKAWLFLQTKRYNEAESIFISLLDKNKKNLLCYAGLARLYRIQNKLDIAEEKIKEGLLISQFFSILWLEKGLIEYEKKEYEKAIISFTRAINLDYKNNDAKFFRYICYLKIGRDIDDIKNIWEGLLKNENLKPEYFLYHAYTLYEIETYKNFAIIVLKEGIKKFPNDPYILNMLSFVLFENYKITNDSKLLDEAKANILKCLESAKEIEIEFIDTYLLILEETKEYNKIKELVNEYYLIYPDSDIIKRWLRKINELGDKN